MALAVNEYAANNARIIPFIFSSSVHAIDRMTPYAESKRNAEENLRLTTIYKNLYNIILRLPNMLGPCHDLQKPTFFNKAINSSYAKLPMQISDTKINYLTNTSLNRFILAFLQENQHMTCGSITVEFKFDYCDQKLSKLAKMIAKQFDQKDKKNTNIERESLFKAEPVEPQLVLERIPKNLVHRAENLVNHFHDTNDIYTTVENIIDIKLEETFQSENNQIGRHFNWSRSFFKFMLPDSNLALHDITVKCAKN